MLKRRLFVEWAADLMEGTLRKKDSLGYGAWESQEHSKRYKKLLEEWGEAQEAVAACLLEEKRTPESVEHMKAELVDVAVTAMMMAGGFEPLIRDLIRGGENERKIAKWLWSCGGLLAVQT